MFTLTTTTRTISTYHNREIAGQREKAESYSSLAGAVRGLSDKLPFVLNAAIRNDHLNTIVLQFEPRGLVRLTPHKEADHA